MFNLYIFSPFFFPFFSPPPCPGTIRYYCLCTRTGLRTPANDSFCFVRVFKRPGGVRTNRIFRVRTYKITYATQMEKLILFFCLIRIVCVPTVQSNREKCTPVSREDGKAINPRRERPVKRNNILFALTYNVELERQTHFGFSVHLAFIDSGVSRLSKFNQQGPIVRVIRVDDLESLVAGVSQHARRQYVQISFPHPGYLCARAKRVIINTPCTY